MVNRKHKKKTYFKFLRNNPNKRYKRALEKEFDISRGYADTILYEFLQKEDIKRSRKFKWILEPLKEFINKMCLIEESYGVRKKYFLKTFNNYLNEKGLESIDLSFLTQLMHNLDYESTENGVGAYRYWGLVLTSQGSKRYLDDQDYYKYERIKTIKKMRERGNTTSVKACKFICCEPAQNLLKKITDEYFDEYSYRKTQKILVKLEKVCGIGKYFKPKIAVAMPLYIFSKLYLKEKLSQQNICDVCNISSVTLRTYLSKLFFRLVEIFLHMNTSFL